MKDLEISDLRNTLKQLHPHLNFDGSYTFYYDETNNIKKFRVREEDFNYSFHSNFVLGGVLFEGDKPKLENIFEGLGLQNNIKEVKLKHLAFGELEDCLKSTKLNMFLNRILASPLLLHYT